MGRSMPTVVVASNAHRASKAHLRGERIIEVISEWGGYAQPVWVARFCGELIASSHDEFAASLAITRHARERREAWEGE